MDAADAFWAASIASRVSDEMITRIVESARLSDPRARDYLTGAIIKRRNKVVAHWITGTNPLDGFRVATNGGDVTLVFDNAATRLGLAADTAEYRAHFAALDNMSGAERSAGGAVSSSRELNVPPAAWGPRDLSGFRYAIVSIRTLHEKYPHWSEPVRVTLRERSGELAVVGVDRPSGQRAPASAGTN
jgi:methyl coenzyme M reductase subunit C-like uncharacterized protein (methanogenesis marker protein 7)